jgi:amino-acid N-acetyltransferase
VHDIALLHGLGIRLVLVHGARPQIERRLAELGAEMRYVGGLRITDKTALRCVKEAAGSARVEIEALLSMGLANSPMAGVRIPVASGNFVTARPIGVLDGVDYQHTGKVRRIDHDALRGARRRRRGADAADRLLADRRGLQPRRGRCRARRRLALAADKLIYLVEDEPASPTAPPAGLEPARRGRGRPARADPAPPEELAQALRAAPTPAAAASVGCT